MKSWLSASFRNRFPSLKEVRSQLAKPERLVIDELNSLLQNRKHDEAVALMRRDVRAAQKAAFYLRKDVKQREKRCYSARYSEKWTEDRKGRRNALQGWRTRTQA